MFGSSADTSGITSVSAGMAGAVAAEVGTEGTEERAGESEEVEGSMADLRKKCVTLMGGSKKDAKAAGEGRKAREKSSAGTKHNATIT